MAQARSDVSRGNIVDVKDKTFTNVVSLLRFFRRSRQFHIIDSLGNCFERECVVYWFTVMMETVRRNAKQKSDGKMRLICYEDVVPLSEVALWMRDCGKGCIEYIEVGRECIKEECIKAGCVRNGHIRGECAERGCIREECIREKRGRVHIEVPCPNIPSDEEIKEFLDEFSKNRDILHEVIAMALARTSRGRK